MKDLLFKSAGFILVFVLAYFIISNVMNRGSADMTLDMESASLPVVSISLSDGRVNKLHGYTADMLLTRIRGPLTPLNDHRGLNIHIRKYDCRINDLYYEVRNLTGDRLVEKTDITGIVELGDDIDFEITLKDLIEEKTEYFLCLCLTDANGRTVKYYTRIINDPSLHPNELSGFAKNFTQSTFNKENARFITDYIESDSTGDNTNFAYVNIHSSFEQITWGELHPELISDLDTTILDMDGNGGYFENTYMVEAGTSENRHEYEIDEYFRLRYTEERIYLLEFERSMREVFVPDKDHFANDKIMLGITDSDVELMENNDGDIFAFIQNGSLFCYRNANTRIARIFSFTDEDNNDERTRYREHGIKILSVDEGGNIRFMVYGYMNRGRHEGEVCVCVYYYDSALNSIEEESYIPFSGSYAYLKSNLDLISYADITNNFYIYMGGTIYKIRLGTSRAEVLYTDVSPEDFAVSDSGATAAWFRTEDSPSRVNDLFSGIRQGNSITLFNLTNGVSRTITADPDCICIPLGFIGEDFVYGISDPLGIIKTAAGTTRFVMKSVCIENPSGELLKEYNTDNVYITDVSIDTNTINLSRIIMDRATGTFTPTDNDQIMSSGMGNEINTKIIPVSTEDLETIIEIQVIQNVKIGSLQLLTPREVMYEGDRTVHIEEGGTNDGSYFVFCRGMISGIFEDESDAVNSAYEGSGVVVCDNGKYVWRKTVRQNEITLDGINADDLSGNDMADCLNAIFGYEKKEKDALTRLQSGESAVNIMNLGLDKRILNLEGCLLDEVLYYVSNGSPVLAPTERGTMLIIGYDTLNITVLDPMSGSVHKIGLNDSRELFARYGNVFVSYIE